MLSERLDMERHLFGTVFEFGQILKPNVDGVESESTHGTVGRALSAGIVHREQLDDLEPDRAAPSAKQGKIGELTDPAIRFRLECGDRNEYTGIGMIKVGELHSTNLSSPKMGRTFTIVREQWSPGSSLRAKHEETTQRMNQFFLSHLDFMHMVTIANRTSLL
jgi:hypothetical protein